MIGPDAGNSPPQRGAVDASGTVIDTNTPPPPPMDATVVVDVPPDRITVVDTGAPDLIISMPCMAANSNCPDGFYCQSANCVTGFCVAAPASTDQNPVCGCDRLTYWNTSIAAANGASVRATGACATGMATACSANNPNCPAPALCNLQQTAAGCNLVNPGGRCWVLPDTCPPIAAGAATTRRCNSTNACQSACTLIMNGRTFFEDPTCP